MLPRIVEELSFYQVKNRLARLTQDALAARLGTVREVVARSLSALEMRGAIQVNRRLILVSDHERLLEWT
jgi:predicted ArsR family transcriptional regulator